MYVIFLSFVAGVVGWTSAALHAPRPVAVMNTFASQTAESHYPIYPDPTIYQSAYNTVSEHEVVGPIRGVLVNHHLLAASFITDTLNAAAKQNIQRVILISPNHFSVGQGDIITTIQDWRLPVGSITIDREVVDFLAKENLVTIDESPWQHEHGIYNILPAIQHYFPQTTIIPIILKDGTSDEQVDQLSIALRRYDDETTLVVGSFDFSHYKTSAIADAHDEASLKAVQDENVNALIGLDTDSVPGLRLFLQLMRGDAANNFALFHHSNSAKIIGDLALTSTTSYITGVFTR